MASKRPPSMMKRRFFPAQNLTEYSMLIGLVGVVSIAALVTLGTNVSNILSDIAQGFGASPSVTVAAAPGPAPTPAPGAPTIPLGSNANLQLTLADGSTLSVPNAPVNTPKLIETNGVDGTTHIYAESIQSLADLLEQNDKLDPTQAGFLRDIATNGYKLAQSQTKLKNDLNLPISNTGLVSVDGYDINYNDVYANFRNANFDLESAPITLAELNASFADPLAQNIAGASATSGGPLSTLIGSYQRAQLNGALSDPAVKLVVDNAYREILRANYGLLLNLDQKTSEGRTQNNNEPIRFNMRGVEKVVGTAILDTQKNSTTVCNTGQGDGRSLVRCAPPGG